MQRFWNVPRVEIECWMWESARRVLYAKTRTRFVRNDVRPMRSNRHTQIVTSHTETKKMNIVGVDYEKRYVDYSKSVIKSSGLESRVRTVHASVYVVIHHSLTHSLTSNTHTHNTQIRLGADKVRGRGTVRYGIFQW